MTTPQSNEPDRVAALEARVAALGALVKSTLTTLVLRGLLTRAEIEPLVAEAEALMAAGHGPAAKAELGAVGRDLPSMIKEAVGPASDEHDHDH